jgi:TetR/AcrR family transcriptional repressor of nem operon
VARTAASPPPQRTSDQVLDVAERLVQTRGFNGFSYAVRTASLHYHFPG